MTGAESYMEFAEKFVAPAIAQSGAFGFAGTINTELAGKT
jgi:hypothetical protein